MRITGVTGGGVPVSTMNPAFVVNLNSHCFLCLQHVDPSVLNATTTQNPKGLNHFQPIMQFLTGTVDPEKMGYTAARSSNKTLIPVTNEIPPLCTLCYDILSQLYKFYCKLMEIQRKIQNQTEAARRIAKGTTRRGGMRTEFFNRMKIAGLPENEIKSLQFVINNFHQLIINADRKAVLPLLPLSLGYDDQGHPVHVPNTSGSSSCQPYSLKFVRPSISSNPVAPPSTIGAIEIPTSLVTGLHSPIFLAFATTAPSTAPSTEPSPVAVTCSTPDNEDDDDVVVLNEHENEGEVVEINGTGGKSISDSEDILLVTAADQDPLAFEYEGDDDEENGEDFLDEQQDAASVLAEVGKDDIIEGKTELILEGLEDENNEDDDDGGGGGDDGGGGNDGGGSNDGGGGGDVSGATGGGDRENENDVNYWKNALENVIIEDADVDPSTSEVEHVEGMVEMEDDFEIEQMQEKEVELIDLSDSDDDVIVEDEEEAAVATQRYVNCRKKLAQITKMRGIRRFSHQASTSRRVINHSNGAVPVSNNVRVSTRLQAKNATLNVNGPSSVERLSYRCAQCGKTYNSKQRLSYHEKEHLPGGRPRPFQCSHCSKKFSSKKLLEQHERVHTRERPFRCEFCGDTFRQGSTLYRHKFSHTRKTRNVRSRRGTPPPPTFFQD